jgi:hypothetical protein
MMTRRDKHIAEREWRAVERGDGRERGYYGFDPYNSADAYTMRVRIQRRGL